MAFDIIMMQEGYVRGQSKNEVSIERAVDNIDIVCQLAGNANHVGIGSDLDGAYGCEQTPYDLDRISDLQRLPELLEKRGYPPAMLRRSCMAIGFVSLAKSYPLAAVEERQFL